MTSFHTIDFEGDTIDVMGYQFYYDNTVSISIMRSVLLGNF